MLELLYIFRRCWMGVGHVTLIASNTLSGSKLRRLAGREVILAEMEGIAPIQDFNAALAVPGFAQDVMHGIRGWKEVETIWCSYNGEKDGKGRDEIWRTYMVDERGPRRHWIHNIRANPASARCGHRGALPDGRLHVLAEAKTLMDDAERERRGGQILRYMTLFRHQGGNALAQAHSYNTHTLGNFIHHCPSIV